MKKKRGEIIWLSFAIIAVVLLGGVSTYQVTRFYLNQRSEEYVAAIDDTLINNVEDIGSISLWNMNIETRKEIVSDYLREIKKPILYIGSICICLEILLILALFLFLKRKQKKKLICQMNQFSLQQENITDENELADAMYKCMQANIEEKIKEYQGMNSYLAHEQKNLLGILYTKYNNQKDEKTLEILRKVNESIEDFLTVSDFSQEHMERIDVCLVAAEVCDSYANAYSAIDFEFDEEQDYEILAKRRWIYRAISNLVDNAIKYGDGKKVRVLVNRERGCVLVKVEDNGRGICKEQLENIWKNRFRESEIRSDGYGIGLSLVAHVCDLCNGSYYVQSKEGEGTTFFLSFPVAE